MSTVVCMILVTFIVVAEADSDNHGYRYFNPGTVMMGGYYGMPPLKYPNFPPENSNGIPTRNQNELGHEKESVTEDVVIVPDEEKNINERTTVSYTDKALKSVGTVDTKTFPKKTNSKPEDEPSLGSNFPFGSRGSSFFNTFFPIMMRGNSGVGRKSGQDDGFDSGATAIANSFSTGRGGVASSHATSFGDVYFSSALRNSNERKLVNSES